jgi:hypothetical protein
VQVLHRDQAVRGHAAHPANVFWAWILGIAAVSVIATAIAYVQRPDALRRAAIQGPEFVETSR